jgi:hypothetical protein
MKIKTQGNKGEKGRYGTIPTESQLRSAIIALERPSRVLKNLPDEGFSFIANLGAAATNARNQTETITDTIVIRSHDQEIFPGGG